MSWATFYIEQLRCGETVQFRPRGNSMTGKIESGNLCTVTPVSTDTVISKNDIVLCKVNGKQYLHLVLATKANQFLIGNNKGGINGWISRNAIFGKCIEVTE